MITTTSASVPKNGGIVSCFVVFGASNTHHIQNKLQGFCCITAQGPPVSCRKHASVGRTVGTGRGARKSKIKVGIARPIINENLGKHN
jgi:hypothetical protein